MSKLDFGPGQAPQDDYLDQELSSMLTQMGEIEAVERASDEAAYKEFARKEDGQVLAREYFTLDRMAKKAESASGTLKDLVHLDGFLTEDMPLSQAVAKLNGRLGRLREKRRAVAPQDLQGVLDSYALTKELISIVSMMLEKTPNLTVRELINDREKTGDQFRKKANLRMQKIMDFNEREESIE